ncbi:MAG: tetratricopeptide repeat protein [Candidatus Cloacimonetes bacterium]|nr:tetratricopeptide repeat protein [Candidatus Cloacimonadota bacterium]
MVKKLLDTDFKIIKECNSYCEHCYLNCYENVNLYGCSGTGDAGQIPICNILADIPNEIKVDLYQFYKDQIRCLNVFDEKFDEQFKKSIDKIKIGLKNRNKLTVIDKAYEYEKLGDFKTARRLFEEELDKAIDCRNNKEMAELYKDISIIDRLEGDLKASINKINKSLKIAKANELAKETANAYGNLGVINYFEKKYDDAIKFHKKAVAIHKKLGDINRVIPNYSLIGINYLMLKYYDKAKKYILDSLNLSRKNNYLEGMADSRYNLSIYYLTIGEYQMGLKNIEIAMGLYQLVCNPYKIIICLKMMATFQHKMRRDSKLILNKIKKLERIYQMEIENN